MIAERTDGIIETRDDSPTGLRTEPGARIKAVLFDLDGTLLDTIALILASYRHTARVCLEREIDEAWVMAHLGDPLTVTMAEVCAERLDELITVYRQHNLAEHDRLTKLFPGVREALQALEALGLRMAVVSSKMRLTVHRGLDLFQLTPFFDHVIALEDCPRHKPDPGPVLTALERLGIAPVEAVMVGDSPADVLAAKAAGARAVAVGWSRSDPKLIDEAGPTATVSTMAQLVGLIDEWGATDGPRR
ncbi:MAG TPA: HAD-IA family hydrolase [Bacillota bacterium]|jgi:pyrophosphatase PpaX